MPTMSTSMPDCETSPTGAKIRESCDACSSQKIRCGKEKPGCSRCALKGIDCVYGYSRRTGRRKYQSFDVNAYTAPRPAPTSFALPDDLHLVTPLNSTDSSPWMFDAWPEAKPMDLDTQFFQPPLYTDFSNTAKLERHSSSSSVSSVSAFSGHNDDSLTPTFSLLSPSSPPHQQTPHMINPLPFSTPTTRCPTAQYEPTTAPCMAAVLKLIADLHAQQGPIGIDTALSHNRMALTDISRILDCPCSNEHEVLVPVFLVLQQSLSWYDNALSLGPLGSSSVVDCVVTPQAVMDKHCLDIDTQGLYRGRVVLSELHLHVQPLLTKLQQRKVHDSPSMDETASDVVDCYRGALRAKLGAIVSKANGLCIG